MMNPKIDVAPIRSSRDNPIDTLHIETIGHVKEKRTETHCHFPFDGIGLVMEGEGFYQVDGGPVRYVAAPCYFTIWPGARFHYGPHKDKSWEERYICFRGQRPADWVRWHWLPRKDEVKPIPAPEIIAALHEQITLAHQPNPKFTLEEAKLDLERLVYELQGHSRSKLSPDSIDQCIAQWTKEPQKPHDLNETARALGMSYSTFRQRFTERTGHSPHQFLLTRRIEVACARLARSDDPIKRIALESGFEYAPSFNRAFLKIKDVSPGEYRRRARLLHAPLDSNYF